jgi:hypothetical protein
MTSAAFEAWMFAHDLGLSGERHAPRQAAIDALLPVGTPLLAAKALGVVRGGAVGRLEGVA